MKIVTGDYDAALKVYQEALDMRRKLSDAHPANTQMLRDVSVSLTRLGDAKLKKKDSEGALAAYQQSLALARRLALMDSGNAQAQRDVSVSLNKVGDMQLDANDREAARKTYNESLDIARHLAESDPGNAQAQTDLVVSLSRVASVSDNAEPLYRECLDILHKLDGEGRLSPEQKGWIDLGQTADRCAEGSAEDRRERRRRSREPAAGACQPDRGRMARAGDKARVLWRIRLLHTVIWAVFAGSILAIPLVTALGDLRLALWLSLFVGGEVVVLVVNGMRCPLTDLAGRYANGGLTASTSSCRPGWRGTTS